MIEEITISGYKSIKEATVKLKNLNILIGINGAGKSNFLSIFKLINNVINENLQKWVMLNGGAENILYYGKKITSKIIIKIKFDSDRYCLELSPTRDKLMIDEETLMIDQETLIYVYPSGYPYDIPSTRHEFESNIRKEALLNPRKIADRMLKAMNEWKIYHFHDTGTNSPIKSINKIKELQPFKSDGSNLASYLYFLKNNHPRNYLLIEKNIQLIAPYFDKFILEPDLANKEVIYLKWVSKRFEHQMSVDDFSDGTLRYICYATLLQQPFELIPDTIIIDEPELGLHPQALEILASMLKTVANTKQVIVSTQSVEFINHFDIEDLIIVDRDKEDSEFRRVDYKQFEEWLEDYSVGDLWNKNLLGGR